MPMIHSYDIEYYIGLSSDLLLKGSECSSHSTGVPFEHMLVLCGTTSSDVVWERLPSPSDGGAEIVTDFSLHEELLEHIDDMHVLLG